MSKVGITAQLNKQLLADAQRLVDAGQFKDVDELLEAAVRALLQKGEATGSLAGRALQGLMAELSPLEREQFEEFVAAYAGLAQETLRDDDMLSLLEIFRAYGFKRALAAVHDSQGSKVPLSPRYLETVLEKASPETLAREPIRVPILGSLTTQPLRASVDGANPVLAVVAKLYEQEIGVLTEKVSVQLTDLVLEYPEIERWHQAFEAAASMNKRSLRYVVTCVKNYGQKNVPNAKKSTAGRGPSKSERHREQKRRRIKDYEDYWDDKLRARQKPGRDE